MILESKISPRKESSSFGTIYIDCTFSVKITTELQPNRDYKIAKFNTKERVDKGANEFIYKTNTIIYC